MMNTSNLMEETVNERLKFLIKELKLSARAFSAQLSVPESSTRNYLDKGTKLNSEYLERIANQFEQVNLKWLITGHGDPFYTSDPTSSTISTTNAKKISRGQVIGNNTGTANADMSISNQQSLADLSTRCAALEAQVASQAQLLAAKDALIGQMEETLHLLRGGYNRPN